MEQTFKRWEQLAAQYGSLRGEGYDGRSGMETECDRDDRNAKHDHSVDRAPVDVRAGARGERRAVGYGVRFNVETLIAGEFREVILLGAFARYLATNPGIVVLFNHDPNRVIGTTRSGTAIVAVDRTGVQYGNAQLADDDPDAAALRSKLERGKVTGSSFTFRVVANGQKVAPAGIAQRTATPEIVEAEIYELGPVTFPAYTTTTAAARDAAKRLRTDSDGRRARWFRAAESLIRGE